MLFGWGLIYIFEDEIFLICEENFVFLIQKFTKLALFHFLIYLYQIKLNLKYQTFLTAKRWSHLYFLFCLSEENSFKTTTNLLTLNKK